MWDEGKDRDEREPGRPSVADAPAPAASSKAKPAIASLALPRVIAGVKSGRGRSKHFLVHYAVICTGEWTLCTSCVTIQNFCRIL